MQTPEGTAISRVRILIMGAAGVGKTTILQKICSEMETPVVRDPNGQEVARPDSLQPTMERGLHDVNLEITYPSMPGFVFHDSRGLESGSEVELNGIREFLAQRANDEQNAVHVIWYCVSANSCRPLVPAEKQFFKRDRGNVPAIIVFTKLDGLWAKAYSDLKRDGLSGGDAYKGREARANQLLQEHFVHPIMEMVHPPMGYVTFKGLHKPGGQCAELTRKTVEALRHNQNLQKMFVLASKYDLEARLKAAVNRVQIKETDEKVIRETIVYFPHVWYTGSRSLSLSFSSSLLLLEESSSEESSELLRRWWRRINPFVSPIALVTSPSLPMADHMRQLAIFSGTCIIADICFWTSHQTGSSPIHQEVLLLNLQHVLHQYQQEKKELIIQALCQIPNGLSDEEMSEAVQHLILQHGQFSHEVKAQAL